MKHKKGGLREMTKNMREMQKIIITLEHYLRKLREMTKNTREMHGITIFL